MKPRKAWLRGLYLTVVLHDDAGRKRTRPVHVLIALAFHGPRPSPRHHVGHKDGNHVRNHKDNLEYVTPSENCIAVLRSGAGGGAKLTPDLVIELREKAQAGELHVGRTARRFGISERSLIAACRGETWDFL